MLKTFAARLLVAGCCVIATQWPAWRITRQTRAEAARSEKVDVGMIPVQLGNWTGVDDTELDERLVRNIGASSIVNRSYVNGAGHKVLVHLAAFSAAEMTLPHLPVKCYGGAGWKMSSDRRKLDDGTPPYQVMVVERGETEQQRALVVYWYQVGDLIAGDRDELRHALQTLRAKSNHWPPLIKVLVHVPLLEEMSQETAIKEAVDLAGAIYRWIDEKS